MAEFIRTSYTSLSVIPDEHRYLMHSMYEDSDLDGAGEVEAVFDFIERVDPQAMSFMDALIHTSDETLKTFQRSSPKGAFFLRRVLWK
jgi:hypothetical protein